MISLLIDKFVRSEHMRRCCFGVNNERNSVFDGSRSSLFKFIQETMSVKVVVSVSKDSCRIRRSERDVQLLGVISVQMIFDGIF